MVNATPRFSLLLCLGVIVGFSMFLNGCRSYPNCKTDAHCERYDRGTPFCVNNTCTQCRDDAHCGLGQECVNGSCRAIDGFCQSDADCERHRPVCRDQRCGPECLGDDDCNEGFECVSGTCQEIPECRADADCGEGFRCQNNRCIEYVPPGPCADRRMRPVRFDFDEHVIRHDQRPNVEYNVVCLDVHGGNVVIEGHTDERGTDEYNMALGERRARAVRNAYRDAGVDNSRMRTVSFGFHRPVARGSNEAAWSQNRRAETVWD
ncbi:MAG: hypothetical protein EA398_02495 [Deltaproteobacteria bacterium]|nr:MAG: hypothetical protein EA398_02495 [Deltaproteobacteria bacterium]